MALRSILFTALAAQSALAASLVAPRDAADTDWCTFYNDDYCESRSGSVDYDVGNPGIIQNGGAYFRCRSGNEFSLISYPRGDSNGDHPKHCHVFTSYEASDKCTHLDDLGFTTGDGGYYRFSTSKTCPAVSKRTETTEPSTETPQSANYFVFFDDPECTQQSGGAHYSSNNQGCFENGGAYGRFEGDDNDWHIEQYSGTGNYWCTPSIEHCVDAGVFMVNDGYGCVHLDSVGLQSGSGSYKIARHGCP